MPRLDGKLFQCCRVVVCLASFWWLTAYGYAQSGCPETADLMRKVHAQLADAPTSDDLNDILQRLKHVTTTGCPDDGDAWYLRGKVEEKLGLSATYALGKARQFRSGLLRNNVDPFSKTAAAPSNAPMTASADQTPPVITITEPAQGRGVGVAVATNKLKVAGRATHASGIRSLTVHGTTASLNAQGEFAVDVFPKATDREIIVTAISNANTTGSAAITLNRDLALERPATAAEPPVIEGEFHALFIAVQRYDNASINQLDHPVNDARRLKDVLTTAYTFPLKNVTLLENPSNEQVLNELDKLAARLRPQDHLLIFYAGHGHWDKELDQGYWLPSDAQKDQRAKWISNGTLRDYIKGIKARHTLLISDACFSGGIFKTRGAFTDAPPPIKSLAQMTSRTGMTSGTLTEVPDQSVFIKYLVQRLTENPARYLAASELFYSLRQAVISNSPEVKGGNAPVPQYGEIHLAGHEGGDFIFVRKP